MNSVRQNVLVKFGGKTGEGIDSTGEVLAYIAKDSGFEVNTFRSFPSVIKGGNSSYEVHIAGRPIYSRGDAVDILVAFDQESLDRLQPELADDGMVIYDPAHVTRGESAPRMIDIPLTEMAKQVGSSIMRNMVSLGIVAKLLKLDNALAEQVVSRKFAKKGKKVVESNLKALRAGFQYEDARLTAISLSGGSHSAKLFLSGNEAMAFGALAAQCKLFAGYPITPATDIMEWLAARLPDFGGAVVQTEDEIAALCTVIGANYAGVRAMTATSGPGISLMTEALGLSGMTETPAVIVNVQRPGPSAGMPTKHEQSDVKHMVHASHGEFPRIVIAPGTVKECFEDIVAAFNLADRHQCPVIVASDQDLALRKQTVEAGEIDLDAVVVDRGKLARSDEAEGYKRYAFTDDGISPRAFPGQEGLLFLASGDEHDDAGKIDVELPEVRSSIVDKRMKKLENIQFASIRMYGPETAKGMIVGMGSTTGPILEVLRRVSDVRFLQIRQLWPFPKEEVAKVLEGADWVAVVEHNATGQLARLIRSEVPCHEKLHSILKYDGTPFRPVELVEELNQCLPLKIS